jgi:hypothetical protein
MAACPSHLQGRHGCLILAGRRFASGSETHAAKMSYPELRTAFMQMESPLENARAFRERTIQAIYLRSWRTVKQAHAKPCDLG